MRIAVHGASGKVGREVVALVEAADDLAYAGAFDSRDGGALPACDMVIDFSTPSATMALLERLEGNPVPLVVGTTGFSAAQTAALRDEGSRRPVMIGANFTLGFETFRDAGLGLAAALPAASVTVAETYNAQKKPAASGTTQGLVTDLSAVPAGRDVATEINRIGDTPGINTIRLDLGVATIELTLTVASRTAYAAGAIEAARWLAGRPNGAYAPSDMIRSEREK